MVILTLVFVLYFLFLLALMVGWKRSPDMLPGAARGKDPLISIVIPVRNEEGTIAKLLRSIATQVYSNFEVVVVNDDSEDETLWMVSQCSIPNLRIVHNPGKGKKAAITAGVRAARGTIVVTTDADCTVSQHWLGLVRAAFRDPGVMMAFGGVRIKSTKRLFDALQAMEFASLIGSGASMASLGFPAMCNGANLAFRKKAFVQVKGYEGNMNIPSGDDEFLMRKIDRRFPGAIRFIYQEDAVVTTEPQPHFHAFVNQRIRWASKWKHNSSVPARAVAVIVVVFQLTFMINWIFLFTPSIVQSLFFIVIKMILEAAFLLQVCRFLRVPFKWFAFFCLQVLYPPYVTGVAAASFFRAFEWKNRFFGPR